MPTLLSYMTTLAPELGEAFQSTATGGSTSQLLDATWPIQSLDDISTLHEQEFIWRPNAASSADYVRQVKVGGYAPTTGGLSPDRAWTNAPSNGETYWLLGGLPPISGSTSGLDLRSLINEGLKRTYQPVEVIGTPTLQKTRHCLDNVASWLKSETWVLRVGRLISPEDRNQMDPYMRPVRGRIVRDGGTLFIDHYPETFAATDTLYIELLKPAYYHCRPTSGTYGAQSGLSLNTDEAPVPEDWVAAAALVVAWRRLAKRLARNPDVPRNRAEAAAWFTHLTRQYLHNVQPQFQPPLMRFGPNPISAGGMPATRIIVP